MKLNREILRLALPSILANITVPLVGMVDIAVVGHLGGAQALSGAALIGGISVGTMLFDLLYWNFGFLRAGTGGLTAQAYGRLRGLCPLLSPAAFSPSTSFSDGKSPGPGRAPDGALLAYRAACSELVSILGRALRIAVLSGLALFALQWVVVQGAFLVVDCSPEVRELATRYFYIRIWAAPATLSLFALKGWYIGLQDTLRPMITDLWVNLCNILLSLGLGFGLTVGGSAAAGAGGAAEGGLTLLPAMGFTGVAWGTVIAQWTGLALALAMTRKYISLKHLLKVLVHFLNEDFQENADTQELTYHGAEGASTGKKAFYTLNRDLFLRSVGMIAVYIGFTVLSARLGDLMLAVSTILMKLLMLFSYFTDGFAYAGEALTGRFIGERSPGGVRAAIRGTFAWSFGLAGLFMLLYGLGGVPLFRLLTSDTSVIEAGKAFLPWLLLMPLVGCPAFAWDGIFVGATASKQLRNSTLLCAVGFFAVWFAGIWLLGPGSGNTRALHILMAAYFTHLAIRTLYQTLCYRSAVLKKV